MAFSSGSHSVLGPKVPSVCRMTLTFAEERFSHKKLVCGEKKTKNPNINVNLCKESCQTILLST